MKKLLSIVCTMAGLVAGKVLAQPIAGADVSAIADLEKDGAVYRENGQADDAIAILRRNECTLFRVRLFVDPDPDRQKNYGATQGLPAVRELCRRIKAAGGQILLDLHYSDTWADPKHQTKPKAWKDLPFDALVKQVGDYTRTVIQDLQAAGVGPDSVQVGNEITMGLLWPDGRADYGKSDAARESWKRIATLLAAGADAVRQCEQGGRRIPVILHVHGGGSKGTPQGFFRRLLAQGNPKIDFDQIGLSFYPTWNDSIDVLRDNMNELVKTYGKGIVLAEVAYPWTETKGILGRESMRWPQTPQGQADYFRACRDALKALPDDKGVAYVWWYPESVRVPNRPVWRDGNEALFDRTGEILPAVKVFSEALPIK